MIIAIPVDENNKDTQVCISFGRAPYFMLADTEKDQWEFLTNHAAQSQGGAGIKASQILVDQGVNILLTPRCGENAAEVLQKAGIGMYRTHPGSAGENLLAYLNGTLEVLQEIHPGFHGDHGDGK